MLDEFSVLFPTAPRVETTTVEVGGGRRAGMRMYGADEPATQWLLSATDVARLGLDRQRTLAAARKGAVEKSGGTLTSERPVLIAHYEGLELRLERPDRTVIRIRLCVTPRRIYQLVVVTTEERKRLAQIERFFESFSPE
ncbi:MAG TPA: hypothetical protein VMX54_16375 [Vicinamibacteria bacterium]|nr:hypothetical protein [Vicinamibacteria bacterium]